MYRSQCKADCDFPFMFSLMSAKRASVSISKRFVLIAAKPKTRIHRNESSVLSKTSKKVLKSVSAFLLGNVFTIISLPLPVVVLLSLPFIILTRDHYKACVFYRNFALYLRSVIYIRMCLALGMGFFTLAVYTRLSFPRIRSRPNQFKN